MEIKEIKEIKEIAREILFQLVPPTGGRYTDKQAEEDERLLGLDPFRAVDLGSLAEKFQGCSFALSVDHKFIKVITIKGEFTMPIDGIPYLLTKKIHRDKVVKGVQVRSKILQEQVNLLVECLILKEGDLLKVISKHKHCKVTIATLEQMQTYIMNEYNRRLKK